MNHSSLVADQMPHDIIAVQNHGIRIGESIKLTVRRLGLKLGILIRMFRGYIQLYRPAVRKLSGTRLFGQTSWNPSIARMSSTTNHWLVDQQKGNWQSFVRQAMGERWPMVHQTNPKWFFKRISITSCYSQCCWLNPRHVPLKFWYCHVVFFEIL